MTKKKINEGSSDGCFQGRGRKGKVLLTYSQGKFPPSLWRK